MNNASPMSGQNINWKSIALFYIIAIGISAPFHLGSAIPFYRSITEKYMIGEWTFLPACLGTLMAVGIISLLNKSQKRNITFFGNNSYKNLLIAITPFIIFTCVGIENNIHKNPHYFAFAFAGMALVYAVAEEIAWRGYLLDALSPLNKQIRVLLIGLMWWAWHMRFNSAFDWTIFLFICVGGTLFLIKFTVDTQSYFCAAGLHSLIIITTNGDAGPFNNKKIVATVLTILVWLAIGKLTSNKLITNTENDRL